MSKFPIFSVLGIEIEYMLVDKTTLDVRPESDVILSALANKLVNVAVIDDIAVSNELVMHVLEFKNNGPKPPGTSIRDHFQNAIQKIQPLLEQHHLLLLPTGAHPWMNPLKETVRWPHDNHAIYNQFDTIFDCKGHGWANLQCMHLNLPYASDPEFNQLHNSIRLILPLLPALAASTPLLEGKATGSLDSRLHFYGLNQQRIPSISGQIIPEFISTEQDYQNQILNPMYKDISPFDPKGLLQQPWLNSRAAIPKFDVKAIEIRILDSQECVEADIAIAMAIHAILKHWTLNSDYYLENPCDTLRLKSLYEGSIEKGLILRVEDMELMKQWQLSPRSRTIKEVWSSLIERISSELAQDQQVALELILSQGSLSERMLRALGTKIDKKTIHHLYQQLSYCLLSNQQLIV